MTPTADEKSAAKRCPLSWPARCGVLAMTFFLVKGLLWLAVPAVLAWLAARH